MFDRGKAVDLIGLRWGFEHVVVVCTWGAARAYRGAPADGSGGWLTGREVNWSTG